jgi:hypothetical protein
VQALLRTNPGSRRVGDNAVGVEKGVVVRVPKTDAVLGCRDFYLCLNEHSNLRGIQLDLTRCGDVNLGRIGMGDGRVWNDRVPSIRNAQSSWVQSRFYNFDGSGNPDDPSNWMFVLPLNASHYLRDLSKVSSADGGNANDKIDIVHVY